MYTCQTTGNAKAAIVIVPGAGEHSGRYEWLIRQWNKHGVHVVGGDLPGQGRTAGRRGHIRSFQAYIDTVEHWFKEAMTFRLPVFLLGHSMGGLIVIRMLMEKRLPTKGVILSSPCLGLVKYPPKPLEGLSKILNVLLPIARFQSNVEPGAGTRNQAMIEKDLLDPLYVRKVSVRWYRVLRKAMAATHEQAARFPDIPLLVLQAGDDRIVDRKQVESWFNRIKTTDKTYKKWTGLYHEVFNEPERDDVFDDAWAFARRQLQSP